MGAGLCDGEGERAYIGHAPHYILALKKSVFADVDNCLAHFAEFRCPLCRISMPILPKKVRQNGQGRDTLPNSAKWVSSNCPIFSVRLAIVADVEKIFIKFDEDFDVFFCKQGAFSVEVKDFVSCKARKLRSFDLLVACGAGLSHSGLVGHVVHGLAFKGLSG